MSEAFRIMPRSCDRDAGARNLDDQIDGDGVFIGEADGVAAAAMGRDAGFQIGMRGVDRVEPEMVFPGADEQEGAGIGKFRHAIFDGFRQSGRQIDHGGPHLLDDVSGMWLEAGDVGVD